MSFSPVSFLLGLGAGCALPLISRSFRPLAVEATAFGIGFVEDARRILAEQMENLEDIAAEARARREQIAATIEANGHDGMDEDDGVAPPEPVNGRARRRPARGRSRAS